LAIHARAPRAPNGAAASPAEVKALCATCATCVDHHALANGRQTHSDEAAFPAVT
jgi:hypothetical protein